MLVVEQLFKLLQGACMRTPGDSGTASEAMETKTLETGALTARSAPGWDPWELQSWELQS